MNRLYIIGNGFDLAHGYKTGYKDFLFFLILKIVKEDLKTVEIEILVNEPPRIEKERKERLKMLIERIDNYKTISVESLIKVAKGIDFDIKPISYLLKRIFSSIETKNWVDIEEAYYDILKKVANLWSSNSEKDSLDKIQEANISLEFLTLELEKYLSQVVNGNRHISGVNEIFEFENDSFNAAVLNFNYTDTYRQYILDEVECINIHGELNNPDNPIVFGAGDENHSLYQKILELNNNDLIKNIKSFSYLETDNYSRLMKFANGGAFEVIVIGHSCGVSDRTLLAEIFNLENCVQVKLYHRGRKESYRNLTYGISRLFKDSATMREKVQPYDESLKIPQYEG